MLAYLIRNIFTLIFSSEEEGRDPMYQIHHGLLLYLEYLYVDVMIKTITPSGQCPLDITTPPPMASSGFDSGWKRWEDIGGLVPLGGMYPFSPVL